MQKAAAAILALALLPACTKTDTVLRYEGVTSFAGNAIAANTAMQMVDPWLYGVQHTNLKTPAERKPASDSTGDSAGGSAGGSAPAPETP